MQGHNSRARAHSPVGWSSRDLQSWLRGHGWIRWVRWVYLAPTMGSWLPTLQVRASKIGKTEPIEAGSVACGYGRDDLRESQNWRFTRNNQILMVKSCKISWFPVNHPPSSQMLPISQVSGLFQPYSSHPNDDPNVIPPSWTNPLVSQPAGRDGWEHSKWIVTKSALLLPTVEGVS
jgi:hypothetical protein